MLGCNVASLESTEDTKNNQIWERKRFHRKTVYHTKCRIAITSQAYFLINSKHWSREGGCIICTVRTNLYWLFLFAFGTLLLMACALPETTPTLAHTPTALWHLHRYLQRSLLVLPRRFPLLPQCLYRALPSLLPPGL